MSDSTEQIRRAQLVEVNTTPVTAEKTWTTEELRADFDVQGFLAPYVVVRRKADGVVGSMQFRHSPRVYFNFVPDRG